ncbi:MAG TPA: PhzF family phenazine biosynthesis protein [Thermoplasmata archaeon]|nr:PhzF family phenazine biosynthesis protein [Thermoplasmata archaeon]
MQKIPFYIVNAFTNKPFKGNPAGVVLNADFLDEEMMQKIAGELKCSETSFVMKSERADYFLRYFSPLKEVNLCGHATIATFYLMNREGLIRKKKINVETKAGIIGVEIKEEEIFMEQAEPIFKEMNLNEKEIAEALRIDENEIDNLPIEVVSTGLFSLNVPIKKLETVQKMEPDFEKVKEICKKTEAGSIFVFTFETLNEDCLIHARCFAPLYGVNEDAVTGTANGALGAYLVKNGLLKEYRYKAEQGYEVGREGIVKVEINDKIKIGGKACIIMKGIIDLE